MDRGVPGSHRQEKLVLGGGCTSVGVTGWTIGGGYGSYSKMYGTGAANLLEATIVTADGRLVRANKCENPGLYWAMRGGGYGFGVVVDLTVKAFPLPETAGNFNGVLQTKSKTSAKSFLQLLLQWAGEHLAGPHWGEQVGFKTPANSGNGAYTFKFQLAFVDLPKEDLWAAYTSLMDL